MSGSVTNSDSPEDLAVVQEIDFSDLKLGYEGFRHLSQNPHLTPEEKIAFPVAYRRGFEDAILGDIQRKLPALRLEGRTVVDIGAGVGGLMERIVATCERQKHRLVMVDSAEMLSGVPDRDFIDKVSGIYPENAASVVDVAEGADVVICYSVLHYAFVDTNLFRFVDAIVDLLKPGGAALLGDIPNISKRRRFFSGPTGIAFHKAFMKTDQDPVVHHLRVEHDAIDDAVLAGLIARVQAAGCDAYLMPQSADLPMANRRDDLLIQKP